MSGKVEVVTEEVFVFPLSFAQERLWFMEQLLPGTAQFNLHTALRLTVPLKVAVLKRSLNEIARRHETLRTTFVVVDEQPVQVVAPAVNLALPVIDLRCLLSSEREKEAARLANDEAQRPFDLTRGPLVRTTLIQLAEQEFVFLLTMHHIVSDGWSMGIFWQELAACWSAFAVGNPCSLPELPIQYGDFALWQKDWLQGDVLDSQLDYWKSQLAGIPILQLPTDRPRPPIQTFRGAHYPIEMPASLLTELKALSKQEGVTPFMMLLAAFQALLFRYSNQEDIVVGSYIAGRNRAETEGLIGFFLNSLVMRINVSGDLTIRTFLPSVRKMTLDAYAHQDVPFAKLVEELQPERDMSRNPLFQVMFQLLNVPTLNSIAQGPKPQLLEVEQATSVFDISFMLEERAEGLTGHIEYNSDIFDASTIGRMLGHYQTLLEGIVADPDQSFAELPLLTTPELRQLHEWNATTEHYSLAQSVTQFFEDQVRQHPEAIAFICDGKELCYGELNRRANQLASFLKTLGIRPEKLVGICLERSFDFVVALLGVFKAGGAYLPLDPTYPEERLAVMVEDARVSVLLTLKDLAAMFPDYVGPIVCLDADSDLIARQRESNPEGGVSPDDLAYVIYTSGSTGKPKGVAVEHKQLLNRFAWMWKTYPFETNEVCCQKTALNFVDSIWELLGPLLRGIPIVMIPDSVLKDIYALVKTLADYRVTRLWLVPSLLRMILETYPDLQERLPALKFWVTSGEALSVDLFENFQKAMPHSTLYNLFGTSEVWDVTWFDPRAQNRASWRVPIGRPISNMEAWVLDKNLQPVPIGVSGELYVGGVGLARHYINRPELTAEKFIPHPFSEEVDARLYKTGDLVRFQPDGSIEYLERIDHQIKIRGFRIELGEVEQALTQHSGIQQALAMAREDQPGDKRLVAYVVARPDASVAITELRAFLRERLPEYMVPGAFVILESLPVTPNGKLDRQALPKPDGIDAETMAAYIAPQTEVERNIVDIWQQVLRVDRVGTHDNFFDLGGHSFLMFQVYSKLRRGFDKKLSITDLFRYPTINSLAKHFSEEVSEGRSFEDRRERVTRQKEAISRRKQVLTAKSG